VKRIVIIGNSAAGIAAAETIREQDKESKITIVSCEPFVAYERPKILNFLAGRIKERELFYRTQDFYKNNTIDLLPERQIVELNLNKKKAIFKDREFIEFDNLLIATGAKMFLPDLRGIQKHGVVALNGLNDVKFILENLTIAHTVIIVGQGGLAEEIARIIVSKKIDVKFFGAFAEPPEGVDVISDNPILEILGDSDARAVRLTSQKVIGASLVIFSGTAHPNIDFLKDSGISVNNGILVDEQMRTNIPFVFAAGDASELQNQEKIFGWENSQREGQIAGRSICQI
jgi:NAD(P)H-nitrite reductase large subunit